MCHIKKYLREIPIHPNVQEMEQNLFDYIADNMQYFLLDSEFWEILEIMNPELYNRCMHDDYPASPINGK